MSCNTTSCCRSFSTGVRYSKGDFWPRGQANMPVCNVRLAVPVNSIPTMQPYVNRVLR